MAHPTSNITTNPWLCLITQLRGTEGLNNDQFNTVVKK